MYMEIIAEEDGYYKFTWVKNGVVVQVKLHGQSMVEHVIKKLQHEREIFLLREKMNTHGNRTRIEKPPRSMRTSRDEIT